MSSYLYLIRVLNNLIVIGDDIQPDHSQSQLFSNDALDALGCVINTVHRLIICITCKQAFFPQDLTRHLQTHGHKNLDIHEFLQSITERFNLHQNLDISAPSDRKPIEGLKIESGFKCSQCLFASINHEMILKHSRQVHPDTHIIMDKQSIQASVQTFFHWSSIKANARQYFPVNFTLSILSTPSIYNTFITTLYPQHISGLQRNVATPSTEKDIPPLLQVTNWHIHLQDYYQDRTLRKLLLDLGSLPQPLTPSYLPRQIEASIF